MPAISHQEALDRLRANTKNLAEHVISWSEWDREVERILDLRYPSARAPHSVQAGALGEMSRAIRTSSTPDTLRPAPGRNLARAGDLAAAPDAP